MKKLLLGALLLLSTLGFSQEKLMYKDGILSFTSETTQGIEYVNRFKVNNDDLTQLKTSVDYCKWEDATGNEKMKSLIDELKTNNTALIYLRQKISFQNIMASYKCKNSSSFRIVENSKGDIYISSDRNNLTITENYTAKNGYGNDIPGKIYILVDLTTGQCRLSLM